MKDVNSHKQQVVYGIEKLRDNISRQNEPWAEFLALEGAACMPGSY